MVAVNSIKSCYIINTRTTYRHVYNSKIFRRMSFIMKKHTKSQISILWPFYYFCSLTDKWWSDFTDVFSEMALTQGQMLSSRCHGYLTNVFSEHSSCQFSGIKHTIPSANEAQPEVEQRCCGIHTLLYWTVRSGVTLLSAFWWFPFINLASASQPEINLTGYGN